MNDTDRMQILQRAILENAAYGIISTSPDGTITSFNPAAERLLGYAASEIVGQQTPALWHDPEEIALQALHRSKELGERVAPGFDTLASRPRRRLPEEREWTCIRKDGTRIPVNLSVTALWDQNGRNTGFVAMLYDLTERKREEAIRAAGELERERTSRLLRAREHEFRTLTQNLPDNIVRHDREGRVVYVSPALERTLGADATRMLGKRIREMYPDGSYEAGARAVDAALASGENGEIEFVQPVPGQEPLVQHTFAG
jgi:PAS domain S-box-containing protein